MHNGERVLVGTYPTEAAARREQVRVSAELLEGRFSGGRERRGALKKNATLIELAAEYRAQHIRRGRRVDPKTLADYERWVVKHPLAGRPVSLISAAEVNAWYASELEIIAENQRLRKAGKPIPAEGGRSRATTSNTLAKTYTHLHTLFEYAERRGLRKERTNPCRVDGGGSYLAKVPPAPSREEIRQVLAEVENPMHRAALAMLSGVVIRYSALAALQRKHISFERDPEDLEWVYVEMVQALKWRGSAAWEIVPRQKSAASDRVSVMDLEFGAVFAKWYREQPDAGPEAFVFTRPNGRPLGEKTLGKSWVKACERIGKRWRMHSLRSTQLTEFAVAGATIRELQARGGHSTPAAAMKYQQFAADLATQKQLLKRV